MKISRRIANILGQGSDGWEVFYQARAMAATGHDVIELTIGEHDIRTDPQILNAMHQAALAGHTGYAAIPGIHDLRAAVAQRVSDRTGVSTEPENVLITPGGQSALFAAHMAACDPGDRALFIDPYYATYPGTIRGADAVPVPVQAKADDGFQPDRDALGQAAAGAKSLLINTPNNPTGVIYTRETLQNIAEICQQHDLWLISDEVYDTQIWQGQHLSPRALPGMTDRTLVIGSLSKSHAMTGSRIGWIVGPKQVIADLQNLSTHTTYGVAGFVQMAGLYALGLGSAFEAQIAEPFRRRRDLALGIVTPSRAVSAIPANGAMYVMLDIRSTGLSGLDFATRLLHQHKIAVMPGESFGQAAAGHIRVALTVDDARLISALQTLVQFAEHLAAQSR